MYCPTCGKADQEKNTYCRQCGEFLPGIESGHRRNRHPRTPDEQIRLSLVFNLMSAIAGFGVGVYVLISHAGKEGTHPSVFFAMSMLFVIGTWQMISFFNNLKLRRRFNRQNEDGGADEAAIDQSTLKAKEMNDLLPEADVSNIVPSSVTENTTRKLKERVKRKNRGLDK